MLRLRGSFLLQQLLLFGLAVGISHAAAVYDNWIPDNRILKLADTNSTTTRYCSDVAAHQWSLCQNRVNIMYRLFAADILGYCKYDWWSKTSASAGIAPVTLDSENGWLPGFDPDFTTVAFAKNTYLYAVRRLRVDTASDVWLCSSEDCLKMQDVGFYRQAGNQQLMMFSAASYLIDSELALPFVGKKAGMNTECSAVDPALRLPVGTSITDPNVQLCFGKQDQVYGPGKNTFPPLMVPAHLASVGVHPERGPYGRMMLGTFMTEDGRCVRLTLPRYPWLLERGWDKQHGCQPVGNHTAPYVFVSYFLPGFADWEKVNSSAVVRKPTVQHINDWLNETMNSKAIWWRYARALYCDDNAVSAAYSGASCGIEDLASDRLDAGGHKNSDGKLYSWIQALVIENIPILVVDTNSNRPVDGPGRYLPDVEAAANDGLGQSLVNGTHVARWLYSGGILVRGASAHVPWCQSKAISSPYPTVTGSPSFNAPVSTDAVVGFVTNSSTPVNRTNEYNCQLLDSMGLLSLRQGTKDMDDFTTILSPGLIAWQPYDGETYRAHNLGFPGYERVPPQAVIRAMVEAIPIIQLQAEALAANQLATADMTATSVGAALNLYAFTMLALFVLVTAGDFVKVVTEDVLLHKQAFIWVLYVLPPILFIATLVPAPMLALLQEINARRNNPEGDIKVDFMEKISRGYGNYHILIITAYRSQSLYHHATLVCAWVAMMAASVGVILATWLAWHNTAKVKRSMAEGVSQKDESEECIVGGLKDVGHEQLPRCCH